MTATQKQYVEETIQTMVSTHIYDYAVQKLIYNLEQSGTYPDILHTLKTQFPVIEIPDKFNIDAPSHRYVETCTSLFRGGAPPLTQTQKIEFSEKQKELLLQILINLNLGDINSFVKIQFINYLEGVITEMQESIKKYEAKYKMTYHEMVKNYHSLNGFGELEKEDDEMEWDSAVEIVESFQETLNKVKQ